jgi:two-component system, response regulator
MKEITILLVENNENDVFLTRRALSKLNIPYELVMAYDGVEALNYIFPENHNVDGNFPDLILLDLKLPKVDGLQILREIRANDKTRLLPVLIVTSSSEETDIAAANHFGADSYSVKPTLAREYSDLIQMLITNYVGK